MEFVCVCLGLDLCGSDVSVAMCSCGVTVAFSVDLNDCDVVVFLEESICIGDIGFLYVLVPKFFPFAGFWLWVF